MGLMTRNVPARRMIAKVRETEAELEGVRAQVQELTQTTYNYLLAGGVRTTVTDTADLVANPYPDRLSQVAQLVLMFQGQADWGCELVQRIVEYKAGYQMPQGLTWDKHPKAPKDIQVDAEIEFANRFGEWNNLDTFSSDMVAEAVIQAQNLVTLKMNLAPEAMCPDLRYVAWYDTQYKVVPVSAEDYSDFAYVTYTTTGGREVRYERGQCALVTWGSLKNRFEGHPALGGVIRNLERLSLALELWYAIASLAAKQTPAITGVKDQSEADKIAAKINEMKWKLRQMLVTSGDFKLVGPEGITVELLDNLILREAGIIGGATGTPPQHLGIPDILSSRATADNTSEPGDVIMMREESRWRWFWTTVLNYAIQMRNIYLTPALRTGVVQAQVPRYSPQKVKDCKDLVLPAFAAKLVTRREARRALTIPLDGEEGLRELEEADAAASDRAALSGLFGGDTESAAMMAGQNGRKQKAEGGNGQ